MARRMLMEPTRVHRLLKTLAHLGMAQQDGGRRYFPGAGMQVLADQSRIGSQLEWRGRESIRLLSQQVEHRIAFGVMWEGTVSYLLGEEGREALWSSQGSVGVKIEEATCSCLGLVLLAERSEEEVEKIYRGRPIPGFVEGHRELRRALSEIRIRSYAYGRGAGAGEGNALAVAFVDGKSALEVRGRFGEEECGGLSEVLRQVITTVERSWRSGD